MSNTSMLEQAIVDADALKETALKSAESAILEKYSYEVKEAIDSLLEQEDDLGLDDLGGLGGDEELEEEDLGLGGMDDFGAEEGPVTADTIPDATPAVTDGESLCACPEEDEEITIDFNQLAAAIEQEEDALGGGGLGAEPELGGFGGDAFALEESEDKEEELK